MMHAVNLIVGNMQSFMAEPTSFHQDKFVIMKLVSAFCRHKMQQEKKRQQEQANSLNRYMMIRFIDPKKSPCVNHKKNKGYPCYY